ncbi:MAG: hypothetical protein HQ478_12275 [Chloroflexi bacterium]|nr:hypothetical protein [Chloroflexota bacterium]
MSSTITSASVTHIPVWYRKEVGKNAYRDNIGLCTSEWLVRLKADSGHEGLTLGNRFMRADDGTVGGLLEVLRERVVGLNVDDLLSIEGGVASGPGNGTASLYRDHPWLSNAAFDLVGRESGVSAIDLLGGRVRNEVPAYDTTMYFQDFLDPQKGAAKCAEEAAEAKADGYRQMKIKTGRGGRWMLPEVGMQRDADVVNAIREAVGPDFALMVDANFGYDGRLDLLEDFFRLTADANVFWFEEMVNADVEDYKRIREFQAKYAPQALIVCGEVDRNPISPVFQDLIDQGLIDGYQPDIVSHGLLGWMDLERQLAGTKVLSVPHNFGNGRYGTVLGTLFGAASETFISFEDERQHDHTYVTDGLTFERGNHVVGNFAGIGLGINEEIWTRDHAKHEAVVSA